MVRRMAVPIDGSKIEDLFCYVTKGLMWHHWRVTLGADSFVKACIPTFALIRQFVALLRSPAGSRVHENVGNGTLIYAGAQGTDNPQTSVWEFAIYGGVELSGGTRPHEVVSRIYAMTGPLRVQQRADHRLRTGAYIIRP